MAGDWMKFEKATLDKPEVFEMAGILGIDPDAVVGKLLRVWDWFDDQSVDGYAPVTLAAQLNRNTGCAGFTEAMQKVGWLVIENDRLKIPNFSRHNGQTAKDRALSSKRMAKHRGKSYGDSVTSTATKTQPEKRREEKSIIPPNPQGVMNFDDSENRSNRKRYATHAEVTLYAKSQPMGISEDCIDAFFDRMEEIGWTDDKGLPLADWRARFRRYATNWHNNRNQPNKNNR